MSQKAPWTRLMEATETWGNITARPHRGEEPPIHLVSNAHAVCMVNGLVVLVRGAASGLDLPGGTREPHESVDETLARELMEEIGATIVSSEAIFWWNCVSAAPRPYRPHIPHPQFFIGVYFCEIRLESTPTWVSKPESNEEGMAELVLLPPSGAIRMLRAEGKELLACLIEDLLFRD